MIPLLSGNALKLIAAAAMFLDHLGMIFFPHVRAYRIIGRLAMPIYAFMIAEGCKYTRNPKRYFGTIAALAAFCQTVWYLFDGSTYLSILVTFSLSILTIWALNAFKEEKTVPNALLFAGAVTGIYLLNRSFEIDYGFWGCMLPVFASFFHGTQKDTPLNNLVMLGLGMVLLALDSGTIQFYSLLALPLLLCYSGQRGKWNLKYFFYIFYPVHLAALEGLHMLLG